jgi:O-antigen/teichoic acid export membrane protein
MATILKKAFIVGAGMSVGPIVQIIATPWLARAYSPAEFGALAIFMTSSLVLASISCFRHDAAILVVQDSNVDATSQLALLYVLLSSIIGGLLIAIFAPDIFGKGYAVLAENQFSLMLAIAGGGAVLVSTALSMRREEYAINATIRAIQAPAYVVLALFFSDSLINGWTNGFIFAGVVSIVYLLICTRLRKVQEITRQAYVLRKYSLQLTPTFLLDSIALSLPIFFINLHYSQAELGNYSQVSKLISGPLLLVSAVIGQFFLEKSGKNYRAKKSSLRLFKISIFILVSLGLITLTMIVIAGHELVSLILGKGWETGTMYLIVITVPIIFKIIISPITFVFLTHEKTKIIVYWQIAYFFITLIVLSIAASFKISIEFFLIFYGVSEAIMYAIYGILAYRVVKKS